MSGAVATVVVAVALSFAAKVALPLAVRGYPGETAPTAVSFAIVTTYGYIGLTVLAQALVAGVVAAMTPRHRAVLVILAVSVTAALATAALFLVVNPVAQCVDLYANGPDAPCFRPRTPVGSRPSCTSSPSGARSSSAPRP